MFKKETHAEWRTKRSQEQLALGKLPLNAEYRLRGLAENPRLFTSMMSVNEFALSRSSGMMPCGQVTGTSVYRLGWQPIPVLSSMELFPMSQAQTQARRLALVRMLREAQALGAHGVVGVRLTENHHDWGQAMAEFTAIGTAVRWPHQHAPSFPFACTLSGQDVHSLHQSGYAPVGLAFGVCVYYQVASPQTTQVMQGGLFNSAARCNQEMTEYTWGFNEARHTAARCLEEDATCQRGDGVVDVQITKAWEVREVEVELFERKFKRHDLLVTFSAIGTIIRAAHECHAGIHGMLALDS